MIAAIFRRIRRQRLLNAIEVAIRRGNREALDELAAVTHDEPSATFIRAARATVMLGEVDRRLPLAEFNTVYASVKGADDDDGAYLRVYCLYHFAEIRGAHADSFFYAGKAQQMSGATDVRRALRIPKPVERNVIGTFVTAMR